MRMNTTFVTKNKLTEHMMQSVAPSTKNSTENIKSKTLKGSELPEDLHGIQVNPEIFVESRRFF